MLFNSAVISLTSGKSISSCRKNFKSFSKSNGYDGKDFNELSMFRSAVLIFSPLSIFSILLGAPEDASLLASSAFAVSPLFPRCSPGVSLAVSPAVSLWDTAKSATVLYRSTLNAVAAYWFVPRLIRVIYPCSHKNATPFCICRMPIPVTSDRSRTDIRSCPRSSPTGFASMSIAK